MNVVKCQKKRNCAANGAAAVKAKSGVSQNWTKIQPHAAGNNPKKVSASVAGLQPSIISTCTQGHRGRWGLFSGLGQTNINSDIHTWYWNNVQEVEVAEENPPRRNKMLKWINLENLSLVAKRFKLQ